ncbi:unannotated protein [freshwater metagenome]|uniref:Unannotated protein n=1 Tax=freshwater metagenome TaxID=449393 RepID=A0A6J7CHI4_9ZZZZ|nr:hypothetical protein [Actinomycetota bacterium]
MRQFFSWRIWAAFALLVGMAALIKVALPLGTSPDAAASATTATVHTVDFISVVYQIQPSADFSVTDDIVHGSADVIIDGHRTMRLVDGTPGSISCTGYTEIGRCAVLANLLGDAVLWFAIVPVEAGPKVLAPPIVDLLGHGLAQLQNGWVVRLANTVDRNCPQETTSLSNFVSTYGPASTTVIDVSKQRIASVQCSADVTATT